MEKLTTKDTKELKLEIDHIFESGANEIRIFKMVKNFIDIRNAVNNMIISLTEKEIYDLFILVQESKDTGDKEWDKNMEIIYKKLQSKI